MESNKLLSTFIYGTYIQQNGVFPTSNFGITNVNSIFGNNIKKRCFIGFNGIKRLNSFNPYF
jgi:hypothetical protein